MYSASVDIHDALRGLLPEDNGSAPAQCGGGGEAPRAFGTPSRIPRERFNIDAYMVLELMPSDHRDSVRPPAMRLLPPMLA